MGRIVALERFKEKVPNEGFLDWLSKSVSEEGLRKSRAFSEGIARAVSKLLSKEV